MASPHCLFRRLGRYSSQGVRRRFPLRPTIRFRDGHPQEGQPDNGTDRLCGNSRGLIHYTLEVSRSGVSWRALHVRSRAMGTGHDDLFCTAPHGHQLSYRRNSCSRVNGARREERIFSRSQLPGSWMAGPRIVPLCLCLNAMGSALRYQPGLMG